MDENKYIAETIVQQLGGNKFKVMTGASSFSYGDKTLSFRIKGSKIKAVRIILEPSDTYKMEFLKMVNFEVKIVSSADMVYCDQLQSVFTEHTGLYTRL